MQTFLKRYLPVIIFLVPLVFSLRSLIITAVFVKRATATEGKVASLETRWADIKWVSEHNGQGIDHHKIVTAQIKFLDASGREHTLLSPDPFDKRYRDETLRILYDPENSANARIDSFFRLWTGSLFFIFCATIFCLGLFLRLLVKLRLIPRPGFQARLKKTKSNVEQTGMLKTNNSQ